MNIDNGTYDKNDNKVNNRKLKIADMTKIALCTALLTVSSFFVLPLPFTPVVLSFHTIAVNITGLILKPRYAACSVFIYLMLGLVGLPVFSGGTSGPGKLFGITGGFYFGFLFAVILISIFKGKKISVIRYIAVTLCLGLPVQHLFAMLFMCFYNGFNVYSAFISVSLPFIPGDIIKCFLASVMGAALNKVILKTSVYTDV